jgi:large conductance mechanosensitive channel
LADQKNSATAWKGLCVLVPVGTGLPRPLDSPSEKDPPMFEDFKKFALRGNVIDLAVGVIIGAAFGAIVSSLVGDVIMPVIGAITGGLDFSNYFLPLSSKVTAHTLAEAKKEGAVLAWGNFLTIVLNFLIISGVLFLAIRALSTLQQSAKSEPAPPAPEVELLTEIRDLLKK